MLFLILILSMSFGGMNSLSEFHTEYLLNVLGKFERFAFILHFDTPNANVGNDLLRNLSESQATFIASYNASDASYIGLRRPAGIKFVHLVLVDDPTLFRNHLALYGNVILYHTVVFIIQHVENFATAFWELEYLKFAGRVLIMNMTRFDEVFVYRKCYYCGVYAESFQALEFKQNDSSSELTRKIIYPGSFLRLHGQYLKIAHNEFFPYLYCRGRYVNGTQCDDPAGAEWKLLGALSQKLNFTFSMIGGEYDVFRHLLNSTADIVIGGVSINYRRFIQVTFSKFVRYEDLNFLYVCWISTWHYFKLYLAPFQYLVWMSVFGVFFVISFFIKFAVESPNVGFRSCFLMCTQLLVEQTNARISSRLLGRYYSPFILLTLLSITCIVLSTSYKSMLSSILTRPPHSEPYNGDELIANGYKIVINRGKLNLLRDVFSDTDAFFLEQVDRLGIGIGGLCNQIQYISENHAALMDEKSILQYKTLHQCIDLLRPREDGIGSDNSDKLRITIEPIRSAPHAWALTPATPFWKAIDIMIGYLQNGGFLIKWTKDALLEIGNKKIQRSKDNMIERKESDLVTYGCSFLLYIIGNIIASITFCIELSAHKYSQREFDQHAIIMNN